MSGRYKVLKITSVVASIWVLSQSFTLSLPINLRVLDANTHAPLDGAIALAVWKTYTVTLAGANPGPSLMAKAAKSDAAGWVHLPMSFTFHGPLAPFSWYARDWDYLPQLLIGAAGHELRVEYSPGFWPFASVVIGSPPVTFPLRNGRSIELQSLAALKQPIDASQVKVESDELAFTSQALSQLDRCIYVAPMRKWLKTIEATQPPDYWRDDEFDQLLAHCL